MAQRRNKTVRDLVISMALIVVVVGILAWLFFGASFSPGRASGGATPSADVTQGFARADGQALGFTPVTPVNIPGSWTPNSFAAVSADRGSRTPASVRGGWVLPDGSFVELVESGGPVTEVLTAQVGTAGAATGTVTAGGADWARYPGVRQEQAWVRTSGAIVYLITGDASPAAFTTVAASVAGH